MDKNNHENNHKIKIQNDQEIQEELNIQELKIYLKPTYYMDYNTPEVAHFAQTRCDTTDTYQQKAVKLYYAVRDEIRYDPYDFKYDRSNFKASSVLSKMSGYCVGKAVLLAAVARRAVKF